MEKIHWKKVFNSDYLGSCDLEDGKDLRAIIKNVIVKKVKNSDGKESEKNVAYFTDPKLKPMILNATNCKIIKKFAKSPYINDWNNIPVQIYTADVRAFGEMTEGLRIRETQPIMSKPKLTRDMPAWNNAIAALKEKKPLSVIEARYDISEIKDELLREATV